MARVEYSPTFVEIDNRIRIETQFCDPFATHVYEIQDDDTFVLYTRDLNNNLVEDTANPYYHKRWILKQDFTDFASAETYAATL